MTIEVRNVSKSFGTYHALNDVRHTADLRSLIDAQDKFGGLIAYNTFATRKMLGHYLGERMTQ